MWYLIGMLSTMVTLLIMARSEDGQKMLTEEDLPVYVTAFVILMFSMAWPVLLAVVILVRLLQAGMK